MKTIGLVVLFVAVGLSLHLRAQDTVCGWNFPTGVAAELYANHGQSMNLGVAFVEALDTAGVNRAVTFTNGVTAGDYAATTTGWDNGDSNKFWQVSFLTQGYENLVVQSKQRSGNSNPGPKFYRIQYQVGSAAWSDVPGSSLLTVANDWTTGVVASLSLPADCNNTADTVRLRWLMITNESITGTTVGATGSTKIDDIYITGQIVSTGLTTTRNQCPPEVYPTLADQEITLIAATRMRIEVIDLTGHLMLRTQATAGRNSIQVSDFAEGIYLLRYTSEENGVQGIVKLIIAH